VVGAEKQKASKNNCLLKETICKRRELKRVKRGRYSKRKKPAKDKAKARYNA